MKKIINKNDYLSKVKSLNDAYWNRSRDMRWVYMEGVVNVLKTIDFETILEIGAYKICYSSLSDNLDLEQEFIDPDNLDNNIYIRDAADIPYPITDKYYDVVLACQTFEHFGDKQKQVFDEIQRIGKQAIITIPWKWDWSHMPDNVHHNINESHALKWFGNTYKDFVVKDEIKSSRRLLHFNFK